MALNSNVFVTLANVKLYLGISTTTDDELLEILINQATDTVEAYLGLTVLLTTYTNEVYDGGGTNELFLKNYPVDTTSVTLQYRNTTVTNNDSWSTVTTTDYFIYGGEGYIWKNTPFIDLPQHYRATYDAGWASGSVPDDLKLAVMKLVSGLYNRMRAEGKKSEKLGEYAVSWMDEEVLDKGIELLLAPYRRMSV